jgi:hypothetical protein
MQTLLLANATIFFIFGIFFVFCGTNVITKFVGFIPFSYSVANMVTYLQIVFPNVNWV